MLLRVLDTDMRADGSDLHGNGSSGCRSVRNMLTVAMTVTVSMMSVVVVARRVVLGLVVVGVVWLVGLVLAVPVVAIGSQQVTVLPAMMSAVFRRVSVSVFAVCVVCYVSCHQMRR